MNNLCEFSVTAPAETVIKKLSKANIAAFNVKKCGNKLTFQVRDETAKKVFAIFAHPCYNIAVKRKSRKGRLFSFAFNRAGLIIGAFLFTAAAVISNSFIFKITVTGSGSYLESEVTAILREAGITVGSYYKGLDKPLAQAHIMALPNVTFCSIEREGSALIVDVQTDAENSSSANYQPLSCDADGIVRNLVVVCGTAEVQAGNAVKKGDTLIGAYTYKADGERLASLAVGYAEIECAGVLSVSAPCESDENRENALNAPLLISQNILEKSCTVKSNGETVVYEVNFTYLHTVSINME